MKFAATLLAVFSLIGGASSGHAAPVQFPGRAHRAPSPDGGAVIINTDHDKEPNHVLSIIDQGRSVRRVLSYGRHVDVSWSPDSKFFFVNDYDGSDVARCVLVDRKHLNEYDTRVLLQTEIDAITARYKGSNWLVTCSSWQKGDKVKVSIKVYGNGMDEEVVKWFLFDAKSGAFTGGG